MLSKWTIVSGHVFWRDEHASPQFDSPFRGTIEEATKELLKLGHVGVEICFRGVTVGAFDDTPIKAYLEVGPYGPSSVVWWRPPAIA